MDEQSVVEQENPLVGDQENSLANSISLYPNPTAGKLIINNEGLIIQKVEVYNILGEKLKQIEIENQKQIEIDLSNCKNGIYFLNCITDKGEQKVKVVKQ